MHFHTLQRWKLEHVEVVNNSVYLFISYTLTSPVLFASLCKKNEAAYCLSLSMYILKNGQVISWVIALMLPPIMRVILSQLEMIEEYKSAGVFGSWQFYALVTNEVIEGLDFKH